MTAIADHLWQSTWFALVVCLLAVVVRRDAARIRYWLWLAASLKFLVPFAFLGWIGNHFIVQLDEQPALLPLVLDVASPLEDSQILVQQLGADLRLLVAGVWLLGCGILLARWAVDWLRSRIVVHRSVPTDIIAPLPVRCADGLMSPAVAGILNPVVLLPRHALSTLTTPQLDAVLAHEMWHVRRHDNALAALHRFVQSVFWFHPLVWWIGGRLAQEREHACDEGVLREGHEPLIYARTLLDMCRHSVAAPEPCAASALGGDLGMRIRSIVEKPVTSRIALLRRVFAATVLAVCVSLPVAAGMTVVATSALQLAQGVDSVEVSTSGPAYVVVQDDYIYARNTSLRELISHVYAVHVSEVRGHEISLDHPRYDIALRSPVSTAADNRVLVAELLKRRFNLELVVRPQVRTAAAVSGT